MDYDETVMTLEAWIPLWLAAYKKGTIRDSSYHQLELLERLIPEDIKARPMSDIRPMELQAFFNAFAESASKSYIDKMRVMVNVLFVEAIENEFCSKNPMQKVKIPRVIERQREAFTIDDVMRTALNSAGNAVNANVRTAWLTSRKSCNDFSSCTESDLFCFIMPT